ncbi:MAG: prolyl oligopeptidase family serine peptidase [Flavobacteriaceae bacterium]|nr:prolyl oligopeptidase family serine peptidase [Flavobacteriaceae bacterium]
MKIGFCTYRWTIAVLFCMVSAFMYAQDFSAYKKEHFISEKDTLPYRVLFPKNYDATTTYPLILFMHGSGERGTDNIAQLTHGAELFLRDSIQSKYPAFVVFPQCKKDYAWNNASYTIVDQKRSYHFPKELKPNLHLDLVEGLLKELQSDFSIDDKKIYVGGLSNGGMGTFEIVRRNPNKFAAAFPICGGANPKIAGKLQHTPLWLFHGDEDSIVPFTGSTEVYKALKKLNAPVRICVYEGVDHDSWNQAFEEPDLLPWLFSHSKK